MKDCKHNWQEDELFACGAITVIEGTAKQLVEGGMNSETRIECKKCGKVEYSIKDKLPPIL